MSILVTHLCAPLRLDVINDRTGMPFFETK